MSPILVILIGFALLIAGGEMLVRGAVRTAEQLGVSPLLIGIVLVGFGTSMPEIVVSVQAAATGSPGIAIGNFVGSCISNILLILGLSALLAPVEVASRALTRDGTVVVLTAIAFTAVSFFLPFGRLVGVVFIMWLVSYLLYAWRQERVAATDGHSAPYQKAEAHHLLAHHRLFAKVKNGALSLVPTLLAVTGLVIIITGGHVLVDGAVTFAREMHVAEEIIGLTIVAIGTSMPELITCVIAAYRGHSSVAIGNILGSNIYNILGVGGFTALVAPTIVPDQIVWFDNFVMLGASAALVAFAHLTGHITRLHGAIFCVGYVAYIAILWPK
jgi:cation:H+ antiporter